MNIDIVIDKIKKAVRLARGTTSEGERDNALRLARQLAEKNGLSFDDITVTESDARAVIKEDNAPHHYDGPEIGHACFILKEHFGVAVMFTRSSKDKGKMRITWFGTSLNIEIAKFVWHILLRESRKAWRGAYADMKLQKTTVADSLFYYPVEYSKAQARKERVGFMRGFFFAIHVKLTESPLRNDAEQFASEKAAAEKKLDEWTRGRSVRQSRTPKNEGSSDAIARGFYAGKRVNLSRPCEGNAASPVALGMRSAV